MKKFLRRFSFGILAAAMGISMLNLPVVVEAAGEQTEYKIYPTPHEVVYGDSQSDLSDSAVLIAEDAIDEYTVNRTNEALEQLGITSVEEADALQDGTTNVLVGVYGSDGVVDQYFEENQLIDDETLFTKSDSYILSVDDNVIAVLGKDTDAAFYGMTSLKQIAQQVENGIVRDLKINDYSDVAFRGFIEGYYGNPWSNEDRAELMKFGGEFKMNQYIFAPKDDPYHNSQWRTLYPDEELAEIAELARVGNETKCRYVWSIHPFMYSAFNFNNYENDLAVIEAKFQQLLDAGVRQFGVLADDAAGVPVENTNRLLTDLTEWLESKQAEYEGLKTDLLYCPSEYYSAPSTLSKYSVLPENVKVMATGGKIWGEVARDYGANFTEQVGRPTYMWTNWPCTDNSKNHLIMGGYTTFLHTDVEPGTYQGIVLNPMQQSEPSKVAIFGNAEFAWNMWESEEKANEVWNDAFSYVDHLNGEESAASNALRELSKHMINQNMDTRVTALQESVELAPKLDAFLEKVEAGTSAIADAEALIDEFQIIKDAAVTYETSHGNARTYDQIQYWINSAKDTADAAIALLHGYIAYEEGNNADVWTYYSNAQTSFENSKTYGFWYVDHTEYAEFGVQHIVPFVEDMMADLASKVSGIVDPTAIVQRYITNRSDNPGGDEENVFDGSDSTYITYSSPNSIAVGEYVGVMYNRAITVNSIEFKMGNTNLHDTFTSAKLQYTVNGSEWIDIEGSEYTDNRSEISMDGLDIEARGIRLIATGVRSNTWLSVREININDRNNTSSDTPSGGQIAVTPYRSAWNIYSGNDSSLTDGNDSTYVWYNPGNISGGDYSNAGEYFGMDAGSVVNVGTVRFVVGASGSVDKWTSYHMEYSVDGQSWTTVASYTGASSGQDIIEEDLGGVEARYVRLVNDQHVAKWIRFSEMSMTDANYKTTDYTYTNSDACTTIGNDHTLSSTSLEATEGITLQPGEYVGIQLERIKEIESIDVDVTTDALTLQFAENQVEWRTGTDYGNVRYIRLINNTDSAVTFDLNTFTVNSVEVEENEFVETTMGINSAYGANDSRRTGTLLNAFDGELDTVTRFQDYPQEGGYITYKLGQTRSISKIRMYNTDGELNYLRDGKIQVSADGEKWVDVAEIGDGVENDNHDSQATDGWTHDSVNPGNYYFEGELDEAVEANYIRILFTADYDHRFIAINEFVINDGEVVKTVNDPTYSATGYTGSGEDFYYLTDGDYTTAFTAPTDSGEITYKLSENTNINYLTIIQSSNISNATVMARVGADEWITLGTMDASLNVFYNTEHENIFEIKIVYDGVAPSIYEIIARNVEGISGETDKTALNEAIAAAEAVDGEDYTANSWQALQDALTAAQTVADNATASQSEINNAANALNSAVSALQIKASEAAIDALQNVVDKANALQEDSLAELIANAQALLDDPANASSTAVVSAMLDLSEAMADLNTDESSDKLKEDLLATIDYIEENILPNLDNVRPGKVQEPETAIAQAYQVYNNAKATDDEIRSAIRNLTEKAQELWQIVSKAELNALIEAAEAIAADGYSEVSYEALQAAIEAAKGTAADDDATTTEVTTAITNLAAAIANLEEITLDTSALEHEIELVTEMIANLDDYVPSSVEGLENKLEEAKLVLHTAETQSAVDTATAMLREARLNARTLADKEALYEALAAYSGYSENDYTPETWTAFYGAYNNALRLYNDPEATQADVNAAVEALNAKADALVEAPASQEPKEDAEVTQKPAQSAGSTTAATAAAGGLAALLVLGAGAALVLKRRRDRAEA